MRHMDLKKNMLIRLPAITLFLLIVVTSCWSFAAACEDVREMPADAKEVANGVVTSSPFSAEFTGGQSVFVKVRNDTVHLTPITVVIKAGKSGHEYCSSALDIPPQKTLIFTTAVFGEKVYWGIRVEAGDVDAVQLSVNAFSTPIQKK